MNSITYTNCKNCGHSLKRGEKEIAEKQGHGECAECQYRLANGTRTISTPNVPKKEKTPRLLIEVDLSNEALQNHLYGNLTVEFEKIARKATDDPTILEELGHNIMDHNGNTVGRATIEWNDIVAHKTPAPTSEEWDLTLEKENKRLRDQIKTLDTQLDDEIHSGCCDCDEREEMLECTNDLTGLETADRLDLFIDEISQMADTLDHLMEGIEIGDSWYGYGRYGLDQVLGNGNRYDQSLVKVINRLREDNLS